MYQLPKHQPVQTLFFILGFSYLFVHVSLGIFLATTVPTEHEWDIDTPPESVSPEDDWTDGIIGQFCLVIVLARLVWLHISSRS